MGWTFRLSGRTYRQALYPSARGPQALVHTAAITPAAACGAARRVALPTYSGLGVYTQTLTLSAADLSAPLTLDLGQVLVAAEVFVNGKSAGVRLARPFTFDLFGLLRAGDNTLEVRVANTIAPHYTTIPSLAQGPTESGLIGPVSLYRAERK